MEYDKSHGGPYDRGSADYYYGRPWSPHYYIMTNGMFSEKVDYNKMTEEEVEAYTAGYDEETARKEW